LIIKYFYLRLLSYIFKISILDNYSYKFIRDSLYPNQCKEN
ncbi:unnamed protein product, partial [marine sediment metagenome]